MFIEQQDLCTGLVFNDIETQILAMFSSMEHDGYSAATIRQQDLKRYSRYWSTMRTTICCLVCIRRRPEHILECGHGICDTCLQIYGEPLKGKEYHFKIHNCVVCQASLEFEARISPPTAYKRMLSLDGGGVKAVVSLRFLEALEKELALPYSLREHFDYGIGTSSGK